MKCALLSTFALLLVTSVLASPWSPANDPNRLSSVIGRPFETRMSALPMAKGLSNIHYIWSDTYWPANKGGIAYRWYAEPSRENPTSDPKLFTYHLNTKREVEAMSLYELERLSPAEKYDIFMGRYDYPLTKHVLAENKITMAWWEGICHGWALAAVVNIEPARVELKNADGILVPFGSQDVKGLLDYYYAKVHEPTVGVVQVGRRCQAVGKVPGEGRPGFDRVLTEPSIELRNSPDCTDMNPGAFHLVLGNLIGLSDVGFVADVDRYADIWNQPIFSYSSKILSGRPANSAEAARGLSRIVRVHTDMTFGEELNLLDPEHTTIHPREGGFMTMDPVTGTAAQTYTTRPYEYTLEIDKSGRIVGGDWISESRVDFLWSQRGTTHFSNAPIKSAFSPSKVSLGGLNRIYVPVTE